MNKLTNKAMMDNYGYSNLLMILPITLWTLLFFRKHKYNFYETFIIISYVMGMGMLMFSIEPIINKILPQAFIITETVVIIISFIYMSWAIGQVYKKKFKNYIKALFAYILGFFTFQIVVIIIGTSYDLMTKK